MATKLSIEIADFILEQAVLLPQIVSGELKVTITVDGVIKAKFREKEGVWNIVEVVS